MSILTLPPSPGELRPLLHAKIERLPDEDVAVLHHIALELELESLSRQVDEAFDEARAAGRLARLPEIIREARAAVRARTAP